MWNAKLFITNGIGGEEKRLWSNLIYCSKYVLGLKKTTKFLKIGSLVIDVWS